MPDRLRCTAVRSRSSSSCSMRRAASLTSCNAALFVDDEDPFDHAGENGLHPRAIARQLVQPAAELLDRCRRAPAPPCRARRRRSRAGACVEVAGGIASRHLGDRRARGRASGSENAQASTSATGSADANAPRASAARSRGAAAWIVGQRQRQAHERHLRMPDRHGDVQHVDR